jgi:hypothetical protein
MPFFAGPRSFFGSLPHQAALYPPDEAVMKKSKSPRTGKAWNLAICEAIEKKAVIEFNYNGSLRTVEPQCHGTSTAGNEVLRGFQIKNHHNPSESPSNKLFEVSKISVLKKTAKTFSKPGPHYNPNDKAMSYVHCHL